jgi:ATP-binding cassette subfamily F protein 3
LLQLARLCAEDANLLLLDEPSSHLDTYAQIALEQALAAYPGAVVMVSHDFYTIANCADTILYAENGTLRSMSPRAFRKMIYKRHFRQEYLEAENKKHALEVEIDRSLERSDTPRARQLWEELVNLVEKL